MIPKILFRTVPAESSAVSEELWERCKAQTEGWIHLTYRDGTPEMETDKWPRTGHLWDACTSGANKADFIRLEAMEKHGGIYVDSDVEILKPLDALLFSRGFAAWEDTLNIPNAIFGAEQGSSLVTKMLDALVEPEWAAKGDWWSGPGLFNRFLKDQNEWLILPPGSLYPYHYLEKKDFNLQWDSGQRRLAKRLEENPWAYFIHHWNASWKVKHGI